MPTEVWHNNGDGSFSKLGLNEGFLQNLRQATRTVAPIDHDGDGDIDILAGNYRLQRNQFYENNGNGTVNEAAQNIGMAGVGTVFQGFTYFGHTIGLAWGDLDNDGDFDNVTANLAHPRFYHFSNKTQILLNDGNGNYTDASGDWQDSITSPSGMRFRETHSVPALADFDHNGHLDLAITEVYDGRPTDFYWGNGDGTFTLDTYNTGITTENGWGIAVADFDNDGDPDVFADHLFENTSDGGDHWLQTKVVGVTSNRAGIGAVVRVTAGSTTYSRYVQGGSGKGGQDSLYLHFGLGSATTVDQITVTYPGGATVTYPGPIDIDQRVWLVEDSTTAVPGWSQP